MSRARSFRISRTAHSFLVVFYRAWLSVSFSLLSLVSSSRPVSFPATRELQLYREGWEAGKCPEQHCMRLQPCCQSTWPSGFTQCAPCSLGHKPVLVDSVRHSQVLQIWESGRRSDARGLQKHLSASTLQVLPMACMICACLEKERPGCSRCYSGHGDAFVPHLRKVEHACQDRNPFALATSTRICRYCVTAA